MKSAVLPELAKSSTQMTRGTTGGGCQITQVTLPELTKSSVQTFALLKELAKSAVHTFVVLKELMNLQYYRKEQRTERGTIGAHCVR